MTIWTLILRLILVFDIYLTVPKMTRIEAPALMIDIIALCYLCYWEGRHDRYTK